MKKFMMLYNGPATPYDQVSPETAKTLMAAYAAWMEKMGPALVDMGQPMDPRMAKAVAGDGSQKDPLKLNGYSVVEAEDLDAAAALAEDHPFLSTKTADFSVEVFELLPVPGM